jgi:hypothetical protein
VYYNAERNSLKIMDETKDLFPLEHTCQNCMHDFSFTSLDDFHLHSYSFGYTKYETLGWYCPACKSGRHFPEHLSQDRDIPDAFKEVKRLVFMNKAMNISRLRSVDYQSWLMLSLTFNFSLTLLVMGLILF